MTKPHRATPEQWESIELYADSLDADACILELRARIEALEAAQPHQDKLDRLIAIDRDDPAKDAAQQPLLFTAALAQPEPAEMTDEEIDEQTATLIPWLLEEAIQAADSDQPYAAGKLTLAAQLLGECRPTIQPEPVAPTDEELMAAARKAVDTYPRGSELPYFLHEDSSEYEPMLLALRSAACWGTPANNTREEN